MLINKFYLIVITCILFVSCGTSSICEGFNLKRIPYDSEYYLQILTYTNGQDTVRVIPEITDISKESIIDPISNPDCSHKFSIYYEPSHGNKISILYSFSYEPEEIYTMMNVFLNNSDFVIKVTPSSRDSVYIIKEVNHLNNKDSSAMVKNVLIQNMYITEFETLLGDKWKLIKL